MLCEMCVASSECELLNSFYSISSRLNDTLKAHVNNASQPFFPFRANFNESFVSEFSNVAAISGE